MYKLYNNNNNNNGVLSLFLKKTYDTCILMTYYASTLKMIFRTTN